MAAGRAETVAIEVVAAQPPAEIVERHTGASGRGIGHGTYTLKPLPSGSTQITSSTPGSAHR